MKAKIKDLKDNPYRHLDIFGIDEARVERLIGKIKRSGYWGNIIARKHNGELQMAEGHHRREALMRLFGPDHEVDFILMDLTDEEMINHMADENDPDNAHDVSFIDMVVNAWNERLDKHPEEIITKEPKRMPADGRAGYHESPRAFQIAEKCPYAEGIIYESLKRLNLINKGILDASITTLPSNNSAEEFRKEVQKREIPKEDQRILISRMNEKGYSGTEGLGIAIEEIEFDKKYPIKPPKKNGQEKINELRRFFKETKETCGKLKNQILSLRKISGENIILNDSDQESFKLMLASLLELSSIMEPILKLKEYEPVQ